MGAFVALGIGGVGFVFGYLLHYAVKHTSHFTIEMLSVAIGAVGGATVIGLLIEYEGWIGPYGIGLATGFIAYMVLSLLLDPDKGRAMKEKRFLRLNLLGASE
jgi:predicted exporter